MKIFAKSLLGTLCVGYFGIASVFAAGIDHFNVTMTPDKVEVGESVDLIIEAITAVAAEPVGVVVEVGDTRRGRMEIVFIQK